MAALSRGTLLRSSAIAASAMAIAVASALPWWRRRGEPAPAPGTSAVRVASFESCSGWERDYRELAHDLAACSTDDECVLEPRGGVWFELDGCFRARSNRSDMTRADELADRWAALGCAHDYETCPPPGPAMCLSSHCVERPPPGVPPDWKRVDLGRVVSFFVPQDMVRQPAHPEDSIVRVMASPNVSLFADLGAWSNPLKLDRKPTVDSDNPQWALLDEKELIVGGVRARRVAARNVWSSWCAEAGSSCRFGWHHELGLHVPEVPYHGLPTLLLPQHPKLTVVVQCDVLADCAIADTIFGSITFW